MTTRRGQRSKSPGLRAGGLRARKDCNKQEATLATTTGPQTASLQGSVNGKAASVSLRRQTGDGKDITKMKVESPVQNVEATLSFSSEWEWSLEVTSDAFSSKISLEMAEEDKMEMKFESSTYSGKAEWELTNYVSNNKIKFDSELEIRLFY